MCSGCKVLVEFGFVNEIGYLCSGEIDLVDNWFDMLFGMICVCVCFDNVDGILVLGFYVCVKVGGSVLYEVLFVDDVVINID